MQGGKIKLDTSGGIVVLMTKVERHLLVGDVNANADQMQTAPDSR